MTRPPIQPAITVPRVLRLAQLLVLLAFVACGEDGGGMMRPPVEEVNVLQGVVVVAGSQTLLADVLVTLDSRSVRSSDRGQYRIEDIALGEATLSASLAGYLPYERVVVIEEGVNNFDIPLIPDD